MTFDSDTRQEILQNYWREDPLKEAAKYKSGSAPADFEFILAVVGSIEAGGTATTYECRELRLRHITPRKFSRYRFPNGTELVPRSYIETWDVDACGRKHNWIVYDNALNRGQLEITLAGRNAPCTQPEYFEEILTCPEKGHEGETARAPASVR